MPPIKPGRELARWQGVFPQSPDVHGWTDAAYHLIPTGTWQVSIGRWRCDPRTKRLMLKCLGILLISRPTWNIWATASEMKAAPASSPVPCPCHQWQRSGHRPRKGGGHVRGAYNHELTVALREFAQKVVALHSLLQGARNTAQLKVKWGDKAALFG